MVKALEPRIPLSGGMAAADAKAHASHVSKYEPMVDHILQYSFGRYVPPSQRKATVLKLEEALAANKIPVIPAESVKGKVHVNYGTLDTFASGNGRTFTYELTVHSRHPVSFALQAWIQANGNVVIYVGDTPSSLLVDAPPATPVDPARLEADLTSALSDLLVGNSSVDVTLGPINGSQVGTTFAQDLAAAGAPCDAYDVRFIFGGVLIGDEGNELSALGGCPRKSLPVLRILMVLPIGPL